MHVLIVDDDPISLEILQHAVESAGYNALRAGNGRDALEVFKSQRPEIVISDCVMPDMDGVSLCRHIREESVPHYVYVILITSQAESPKIIECLDAGADDFVTKPLVPAELCSRIRAGARILSLVDLQRAAEDASHYKTEFLANMSHEIRTPMTAILGFTEALLDPELSDAQRLSAVQTVRRSGEHLLDIINDILDISKIEAGKLDVEKTQCAPVEIVADVQSLMQLRADAKKLSLTVQFVGAVPETIESDPVRLKQILVNLLGNAIKFTAHGDVHLTIRLIQDPAHPRLQFEVLDSGVGMMEQQLQQLFQPFKQVDSSTTRRCGGTGLGLVISKRLAELLGGDITVKSAPGQGSLFTATVQTGSLVNVNMLDGPTTALEAPTKMEPLGLFGLNCRVLVAEDGEDNQRLIRHILTRAGATVKMAENGKLAYDMALAAKDTGNPFDVIIMDMQMPVIDGYQATNLLRQAGYTGPIIALTAHAMIGDCQKCLDAGCDEYATKPIIRDKLLSLIIAHTHGAKAEA